MKLNKNILNIQEKKHTHNIHHNKEKETHATTTKHTQI